LSDGPEPIEPRGGLADVRPAAVMLGAVVDIALTMVVATWLADALHPGSLSDASDEAIDAVFASTTFNLFFLPLGLLCTTLGGLVAGWRAPEQERSNAIAVGLIAILIAVATLLIPDEGPRAPWWIDVAAFLLSVPAALAGGLVAERLNQSAPADPSV
jgi:peptidoglycan/LPS O-acetylase OafA/YrhL